MKKRIIRTLTKLFPDFFLKIALDKFSNPKIRKLREREIEILNSANQDTLLFNNFKIRTYEWKGANEKILLIHGWEGQAGNFVDLIEKLKENNCHIFAFDAPSHGFSSRGKTDFFEFGDLVEKLIKQYKVKKLISHSFGGVATTYALFNNPEIEIEKYGLFTTPDKFIERIEDVSRQYGVHENLINKLINQLEKDHNINAREIGVSSFVKEIKVQQAIVFHGKEDKVIPVEKSRNVCRNWKQSTLVEVENLGHFAILRDENTLDKMIEFIR